MGIEFHGILTFSWVLAGLIFVAIFTIYYMKLFLSFPTRYKKIFFIGFSVYVGGALVMEMIDGLIENIYNQGSIPYILATNIEEFFEMTGISILIYALLDYISSMIHSLEICFPASVIYYHDK